MEISRLSFTKKTQEEVEKSLSSREKGKILFARLEELEKDGTLSKAQTRTDVAKLVGYTDERIKAGYMWVAGLISRGVISETLRGFTPSGATIAEYHLEKTSPGEKQEEKAAPVSVPAQAEENTATTSEPVKIEITRGDMTIKVEMGDNEQASKLITTILKGE